ncbi:RNA polymerase sigma factor [Actinoplanes sp. NPDC020271]|uniref:RNA polymerase sigma factor n=1 Tax=Actinoplanes sp. NPDC020271 TaxID=3363896 RepID=UPI003792209E
MDPDLDLRDLYAASAGRLVAQLYGMTGDFAEAQDVVQEAFARAVAARHVPQHRPGPDVHPGRAVARRPRSRRSGRLRHPDQ